MAANLEETLGKLLVPDNNTIQQATQQLKELFKDPNIVPALCQVLGSSSVPQVRQFAAVLLRRKIQKGRQWRALPENIVQNIRENILNIFIQEQEKTVKNAIAQVVAMAAKHDLPENKWPQLFQFLLSFTKSQNAVEREMGMYVLWTVSSTAAEQLKPHLKSVLQLVADVINDPENHMVTFHCIRTLTELIFFIGDDEARYVQSSIPRMLQFIKELIPQDEEKACEALEVFDEMLECEVTLIVPHIQSVVDFCLEATANSNLGNSVRVKAMSFILSLIKLKKKSFLKHKLVVPVLNVLFPVMCAGSEEDEGDEDDDEVEDESEAQKPSVYAQQVIDTMALHLPPEKLIPNLMTIVQPTITSDKPAHRRASYLALAMVAEGCADYITNKHLQAVLECVVRGLNDEDPAVRNAALFALGQFSEHLQPDISKFASELLPLLFQYLGRATSEAEKNPKGLTKSYYALEMFCENLGKDILPYLPTLMEHLINVLKTSPTNKPKELAISAIGATANAATTEMKVYFPNIIEHLKVYLAAGENEEMRKLQIQTLDTLSVLARSLGSETFQPLCAECAQLGLNLLQTVDDPDLRRCVYGLFASLSSIMKAEISPYLEKLLVHMMGSLSSTEGVTTHFKEDESQVNIFNENDFVDEEDISAEDDEEDDEDNKIEGISVENSFLDEKEDTCNSLGELACNAGAAFFPYLDSSFKQVLVMADYPAPSVKKSAAAALGQMCISVHKANTDRPTAETQAALSQMLNTVVVRYLSLIKEEHDRMLVMTVIDTLFEMLEKIGQPVLLVPGSTDAILSRMKEAFTHKLACQDDDEDDDDDEEAEFDGMLIESAGDVLPAMAKLLGQNFMPFFGPFLVDLLKRLKETSSVSEKSFSIGTLAEIIQACGPAILPYIDRLYPLFTKMVKDDDDEVRSNSIFGLGVLVAHSGEKLFSQYPSILQLMMGFLNGGKPRTIDNICAAVCRMINTNKAGVPMGEVMTVLIQCLPLKEDFEENETVYDCLLNLYTTGEPEMMKYADKMVAIVAQVLGSEGLKEETQTKLIHFIKIIQQGYPQEFDAVKKTLAPEQAQKLDSCLTFTNGSS